MVMTDAIEALRGFFLPTLLSPTSVGGFSSGFGPLFFGHVGGACPATLSAPFLKYGTQKFASDASAVLADDPTPRVWLDG
jgi:hypothetical protein